MKKTHPQQKGKSKIQLCYKEAAQFTKDAILVLVSSSSTQKKWSSILLGPTCPLSCTPSASKNFRHWREEWNPFRNLNRRVRSCMEIICHTIIYVSQYFLSNSFIPSHLGSLCPLIKVKKKYLSYKGAVLKLSMHTYLPNPSYKLSRLVLLNGFLNMFIPTPCLWFADWNIGC